MINKVEWSGVLFFKESGEIGTGNFTLTAEEVYPMDMGTTGYTEYETNDSLIDHMMKNDSLLDLKRGHLHSHNSMSVFFSGTDTNEIIDNSEFYNYYLSLIVNNNGEMCAKVAFRGTQETPSEVFIIKNGEGELVKLETDPVKNNVVFVYDCTIQLSTDLEFLSRINEIIEESKKKTTTYKKAFQETGIGFSKGFSKTNFRTSKKYTSDKVYDFATDFVLLTKNSQFSLDGALKSLDKQLKNKEADIEIYIDTLATNYRDKLYEYLKLNKNSPTDADTFEDFTQEIRDLLDKYNDRPISKKIVTMFDEMLVVMHLEEDNDVHTESYYDRTYID